MSRYHPRILLRTAYPNAYVRVFIYDINNNYVDISMHNVVGMSFFPIKPYSDREKIVINHIDGVKWHNEVSNLEWVTTTDNMRHANAANLIERPYGEDNVNTALTDDQYRQICQLTQDGYSAAEINKIMNLGKDITKIAQKIRSGESELLISKDYDFSNIPRNDYRKFTEDEVRYICSCLQDYPEMRYRVILANLGYRKEELDPKYYKKLRDTVSTIKRRVSYIEIGNDYSF